MIVFLGDDLEICPAGLSCCTRDMEIQLTAHSRDKYSERLASETNTKKLQLVTATAELHGKLAVHLSTTAM